MPDEPEHTSIPSSKCSNSLERRVEDTVNAINWDALSAITCKLHQVQSAEWRDPLWGGYNVVRFLHLDNADKTVIVARVPHRPSKGYTTEHSRALSNRISSEVATMEYVATYTRIPIPRVLHFSAEVDPLVGSPYILMSKVDGVPLSTLWDDMTDDHREIVLRQVVDILLELSTHRFDWIGALFKGDGIGKGAWRVRTASSFAPPEDTIASSAMTSTYSSGAEYWMHYANATLQRIRDTNFGDRAKEYDYVQAWFLCSLIPHLYDPSLDNTGFPLYPGDFHSQNIMITHGDSQPVISAVIDWEFSTARPIVSFACYPLFIVDHPFWDDDHPLRSRNIQDQATFDRLLCEAEGKADPGSNHLLSRLFSKSKGVYLFGQAIQFPGLILDTVYPQLFEHIFGEDEDKEDNFCAKYYYALMEKGILKKPTAQFERETEVWCEAVKVLGEDVVPGDLHRDQFRSLVQVHADKFDVGGQVRQWLTSEDPKPISP
ncbi:hypothetical protein SCP_0801730 [Sparassis crispa]|uniref:Aminoglycoside phosphotransferase domain-containing protein n=1 Tax=Sparassis crispa TaxID=139825 RepID=A0A401GTZ6_9APHY|nr:hypothetical protein SCP_0801730 [Sparassis crispa]GBE85653.1 hypothetical protein SCP_0801730 [Sparassis crispa]